ncbi:XK-related protein [Sergentomyia squamirostris]
MNDVENKINRANITHYSIETYFIWFSALIFVTELITDLCLVIYYFHENQLQWATVTLTIIIVPQILCQIYSLVLLKSEEQRVSGNVIFWHLCLIGIPYRYHNILRTIEKIPIQEVDVVRYKIREVNAIQTVNSVLQYCPQFIFQSFLIIHRKYKCVITGVSAGLSGFSFLLHMFIHFFYLIKRYNEDMVVPEADPTPRIIDNLSMAPDGDTASADCTVATLRDNLKDFEKPLYNTDDKNLMVKKSAPKNVEKNKIFGFNKRKPIYERDDDFDIYDAPNQSTVFCEIDDSTASDKYPVQMNFKQTNNTWTNLEKNLSGSCDTLKQYHSTEKLTESSDKATKSSTPVTSADNHSGNFGLKRKGICSSQEMLHLVDLMNENLSAEQVDILAKSLVELGSSATQDESLVNPSVDSGELDSSKLLEVFPEVVDECTQSSILENIDAAIYENQIIFQERIKKNQLTIQNLKLQDQILSNFIDTHSFSSNELMSTRDYENMCVVNINRSNRGMKHWRNYLQDIDANVHDNSTVLNSSFFVTTTTSATDDLYIHENQSALADDGSKSMESEKSSGKEARMSAASHPTGGRKTVRWSNKVAVESYSASSASDDSNHHHMDSRLVETINKINVDSPIKHLTTSINPMDSITESIGAFEESH